MLLSNWAWKMEPGSPDLLPFDSEEVWLFEDDTAKQAFKDETPSFKDEPPSPSSRAQVATKLLQDLDDLIKKDASCSHLAEGLNRRSGNDRQMGDAPSCFSECWLALRKMSIRVKANDIVVLGMCSVVRTPAFMGQTGTLFLLPLLPCHLVLTVHVSWCNVVNPATVSWCNVVNPATVSWCNVVNPATVSWCNVVNPATISWCNVVNLATVSWCNVVNPATSPGAMLLIPRLSPHAAVDLKVSCLLLCCSATPSECSMSTPGSDPVIWLAAQTSVPSQTVHRPVAPDLLVCVLCCRFVPMYACSMKCIYLYTWAKEIIFNSQKLVKRRINSHSSPHLTLEMRIFRHLLIEPYNDWMEDSIDIFQGMPPVEDCLYSGGSHESVKLTSEKPQLPDSTSLLLQEFQTVFEEVELNNSTLTPPQSPTYLQVYGSTLPYHLTAPVQNSPLKTVLTDLVPIHKKEEQFLSPYEQIVPVTPCPDVELELAVVEELVRSRAGEMVSSEPQSLWDTTDSEPTTVSSPSSFADSESDNSFAPPSPSTSSNSSFGSTEEDPEWAPSSPGPVKVTGGGRKRGGAKPYSRGAPEEKKLRKKEQNKNAATRYRQKKRAEVEVIVSEEKGLEDINKELTANVSELQREIKYLKNLMRDAFRRRGLIK
uniref:BZIP domain-containing protein n=1 Tax=Timema cristinae TaxID=61476 RepID=A0A7R9H424_TIMCR|nr:unnamed protein product [Timema cristinae]